MTNLFRITCAKIYKIWLSFVEDITIITIATIIMVNKDFHFHYQNNFGVFYGTQYGSINCRIIQ